MAAALRKIETIAAARSAERQRLAEKIERVTAARERLGRIRAGLEENRPYRALAAQEEAEEVLERARETEAQRVTARITGDAAPDGPSVGEAQRALDAATKEYERVNQLAENLKASEADAKRDLEFAKLGMHDAISAVVQSEPAVSALLKRYQAAQREASRLRLTVQSFSRFFPRELRHWDSDFRDDVSADPRWAAWVSALETDADAPAPEIA